MKCEGTCQYAADVGMHEYSCGGFYCPVYAPKPKPLTLAKIKAQENKHNARVRKLTRDSRNIPIEIGETAREAINHAYEATQ